MLVNSNPEYTLSQNVSEPLHKIEPARMDRMHTLHGLVKKQSNIYVVSAPSIKGSVFMRRFRLFSGQCMAIAGEAASGRHFASVDQFRPMWWQWK